MAIPNSIDSNSTSLAYAEETALKTLPESPVWYGLEPNSYSDFGASYTKMTREPINANRQRAKGTVTDMEAKGGFTTDLTQRNTTRLLQGFIFADAKEKPSTAPIVGTQIDLTGVAADGFTAAAGLDIFAAGQLCVARNCGIATNNGLFTVTGVAAGKVTTSKVLSVEAAPPANAFIETVGFEFAANDAVLAINGSEVSITSTVADFTTMALNVGEWIFVGGDTTLSKFAGNDAGYARIGSIAAHKLVLDFTTFTPVADAGATVNQKVRIFFGKVLVNASDASGVKRRSFTFERQLGNDGDGFQSELIKGCIPNELTINVPQADKMNADLSFVGLEHAVRTGLEGPISKDKTFVSPLGEAAYNTSRDLYSLKLYMVDATTTKPTSLFAYATDLKLTVNNNVTAKKALGVLGAFDANTGIFAVSGTCSAYFATIAATKAIINNSDVGLNAIFAHENCGMVFDLPLLTIGGGLNKIEKDKPVMVDLDQDAVKCSKGYTLLVTNFEYLPTAAMPA